jgi:hypothetical protein
MMRVTIRPRTVECQPGGNGLGSRGDVVLRLGSDGRPGAAGNEVFAFLSPALAAELAEELRHHLVLCHPAACRCGCGGDPALAPF